MKKCIAIIWLVAVVLGVHLLAQSKPKIVFASDATFPPMEFVDTNKNIVGFDIDVIQAIAKAANFEAIIKNTAWDGIFAGLAAGEYDAILSSVTITEERKASMNFSNSYINAGQVIIVTKNTKNITKPENLKGKMVGVQIGTTGDIAVSKIAGATKKTYDEIGLAVEDLAIGRLDAVIVDSPIAANYVLQNEKYKSKLVVVGKPFTEEYYGIAVGKSNTKALELINKGLKVIQNDGTLEKLKKKWLQ